MGNEDEIKTLDQARGVTGFSTSNRLHAKTVERFNRRRWVFAVFDGIEMVEAYLMLGPQLSTYFDKWSLMIADQGEVNNPKIPLAFVRENGTLLFRKG